MTRAEHQKRYDKVMEACAKGLTRGEAFAKTGINKGVFYKAKTVVEGKASRQAPTRARPARAKVFDVPVPVTTNTAKVAVVVCNAADLNSVLEVLGG